MSITRYLQILTICTIVGGPASLVAGPAQAASQHESDNTKTNKRDRRASEPTADQAKENPSDREIMRDIRKAVVSDDTLSTYAHNVKIIAQNGKVTLKGPVRSEAEKQTIEAKATEVAGAGNVVNQITVKPDKDTKASTKSQ
jgi:osmotically-inducible protein OsmY